MRRVAHAPTVSSGLTYAPETAPTEITIAINAKNTKIGEPCVLSTTAASKNVPINSAIDAAMIGDRVNENAPLFLDVDTAFTVVTLVVLATEAVAFFATGFFFAVEADFLVAMNFPPYKKYGFSIT